MLFLSLLLVLSYPNQKIPQGNFFDSLKFLFFKIVGWTVQLVKGSLLNSLSHQLIGRLSLKESLELKVVPMITRFQLWDSQIIIVFPVKIYQLELVVKFIFSSD